MIVPNPFPTVPVLDVDRAAMRDGLISAGHPLEWIGWKLANLPDTDAVLQMLARHRMAAERRGRLS